MSTSARVGILLPERTVRCITVQQDGYRGYAGKILTRHYTSEERILELLSRGDLRSLAADPRDCEVALNAKPAQDVSLSRFINPPFSIDYLYIFTPSDGWQYLPCHE